MKLAFCLFRYFPYGGLQRDFLRIALACQQRGHSITVYTMEWEGVIPPEFQICLISIKAWANHNRAQYFATQVNSLLKQTHYDVVIGFNRMPGLDIYYAADLCYAALLQQQAWFYRYLPRQRTYLSLERAVFDPSAKTQILILTQAEQQQFLKHYQTPASRFHLLPPGIDQQRIHPTYTLQQRAELRRQYGISSEQRIILMVNSNFKLKGVDRALYALAALPITLRATTHLWIIGRDKFKPMQALAKRLQILNQVNFLGPKEALADYYMIADLLLHPAYHEAAGMVLLEALCSGLPILVTTNCGYASHIAHAQAGLLIPRPFVQQTLNNQLHEMLTSSAWQTWHENALRYTATTNLYNLAEAAADSIEQLL